MNYYSILGLPFDATQEEIRDAHLDAVRHYHPDINPDPAGQEEFLKIQQAYEVLSNPDSRKNYDRTLSQEDRKIPVELELTYSRSFLPRSKEPQLLYVLMSLRSVTTPTKEEMSIRHICLVIDCSTSMKGDRIQVVKANVLQFIGRLNPQDFVSIVTFSDRAKLLMPATNANSFRSFEKALQMLEIGGGTEIYQGLSLGFDELQNSFQTNVVKQLILLTDGHTYGDEEKCIQLAYQAAEEEIVISALGIGHEWNDQFLDQVTSLSGGNVIFVSSTKDLEKCLTQKNESSKKIFGKGVKFEFLTDADVKLRYAFRIYPEITPLPINSPISFGNLQYQGNFTVLFEFLVDNTVNLEKEFKLASGQIKLMQPDGELRNIFVTLKRPVFERGVVDFDPPPTAIFNVISHLTLYRMQELVQKELEDGKVDKAKRVLKNLVTGLLSSGNAELAHIAMQETRNITENFKFSRDGEKRIKYGTRALLLPSGRE